MSAFRDSFQKRTMGMHDGCNGWDERDRCYESTTECHRENPDSAFQHVQCGMCVKRVKPVQYVATPHDAGRFLQGMRDGAQGGSAETVLCARLRTNGRSEAPAGRRRAPSEADRSARRRPKGGTVHDVRPDRRGPAWRARREEGKKKGLAATYSPAFPQYHRRESA